MSEVFSLYYYQCPMGTFPYIIKAGDTFYNLANRYRVLVDDIIQANPGVNPNMLRIGQIVCIPSVSQTESAVNEYSYAQATPEYFIAPAVQWSEVNQYSPEQGPPRSAPPNYTPSEPSLRAVDPGAIRFCQYKFTYIVPKKGQPFWSFLVFVGRDSVAGWKYQRGRWVYFGLDLKEIKSFTC